jgi:hypothetical protein
VTSRRRSKARRHLSPIPLPEDGRPVIGARYAFWDIPVTCSVCRQSIRAGVVAPPDYGDPPRRAICLRDYDLLMHDEDAFREKYPE